MERSIMQSHPMRVRGLKLHTGPFQAGNARVAPHAGAWIEIACVIMTRARGRSVAPHAGAWIEIDDFLP